MASKLMEEAVRFAREKKLKIEPIYSYSIYYFIKHLKDKDLLLEELRKTNLKKLYNERLKQESL